MLECWAVIGGYYLELASEDGVHHAGALRWLDVGSVDQMTMEQVQGGDEEFMSVLLFISSYRQRN